MKDRPLLENIIAHREIFYRQTAANYHKIINGGLKLVPEGTLLDSVYADYKKMDMMIYGQSPEFTEIIVKLGEIQRRVNG